MVRIRFPPAESPTNSRRECNAVRLQLHALAYNLGNFIGTLAMPKTAEPWSKAEADAVVHEPQALGVRAISILADMAKKDQVEARRRRRSPANAEPASLVARCFLRAEHQFSDAHARGMRTPTMTRIVARTGCNPAAARAAHDRRLGLRQAARNRLGADAIRRHLDQGALRRQGEGRDDLPSEMGIRGQPCPCTSTRRSSKPTSSRGRFSISWRAARPVLPHIRIVQKSAGNSFTR
jgi:hypothetical protein